MQIYQPVCVPVQWIRNISADHLVRADVNIHAINPVLAVHIQLVVIVQKWIPHIPARRIKTDTDIVRVNVGKTGVGAEVVIEIETHTFAGRIVGVVDAAMAKVFFAETGKLIAVIIVVPEDAVLNIRIIQIIWITLYIVVVCKGNPCTSIMRKCNIVKNRRIGRIHDMYACVAGFAEIAFRDDAVPDKGR